MTIVACESSQRISDVWVDFRAQIENEEGVLEFPPRPDLNECNLPIRKGEMPDFGRDLLDFSNEGLIATGSSNVSTDGALNYVIPVFQLPSPSGTSPSFRLVYSSDASLGYVGHGVNLAESHGALSTIRLCKKTLNQDDENVPVLGQPWGNLLPHSQNEAVLEELGVEEEVDLKFCVDGKRLIQTGEHLCFQEGDPWTVFLQKDFPDGRGFYFLSYAFDANAGGGVIKRFGYQSGSRIGGRLEGEADPAMPFVWAVDTVSDEEGNGFEVEYEIVSNMEAIPLAEHEENMEAVEFYPVQIRSGVKYHLQIRELGEFLDLDLLHMQEPGKTTTQLVWQDLEGAYRYGQVGRQRVGQSRRLLRIESGLDVAGQPRMLRKTEVTYFEGEEGSGVEDRVQGVRHCGRLAPQEEFLCSKVTRFEWSDTNSSIQFGEARDQGWGFGDVRMLTPEEPRRGSEGDHPVMFADLNGDGFTDMYYPKPSHDRWYASMNDGTGNFLPEIQSSWNLLELDKVGNDLGVLDVTGYDGCEGFLRPFCTTPIWPVRTLNLDGYGPDSLLAIGGRELLQVSWREDDFEQRSLGISHELGMETQPNGGGVVYGPSQTSRWSPGNLMDLNGDGLLEMVQIHRDYSEQARDNGDFGMISHLVMKPVKRDAFHSGQWSLNESEQNVFLLTNRGLGGGRGQARSGFNYYDVGLGELDGSPGSDIVIHRLSQRGEDRNDVVLDSWVSSYWKPVRNVEGEIQYGQMRMVRLSGLNPEQWLTEEELREEGNRVNRFKDGWNKGKVSGKFNGDGLTDFLVWRKYRNDQGRLITSIQRMINRGEGQFVPFGAISSEELGLFGHLYQVPEEQKEHAMALSFRSGQAVDLNGDGVSEFVYPCERLAWREQHQEALRQAIGEGGFSEEDAERLSQVIAEGMPAPGRLCILSWKGDDAEVHSTEIPYNRSHTVLNEEGAWKRLMEHAWERNQKARVTRFVDVDSDGDLDLLYRSNESGNLKVYPNETGTLLLSKVSISEDVHSPLLEQDEILRVEYEIVGAVKNDEGLPETIEDTSDAPRGDSRPFVSKGPFRGKKVVRRISAPVTSGLDPQHQWHGIRYTYGPMDYSIVDGQLMGPRWRQIEDERTGWVTREDFNFNFVYFEQYHHFLFARLPSDVYRYIRLEDKTLKRVEHTEMRDPEVIAFGESNYAVVSTGHQKTSYALDGESRPLLDGFGNETGKVIGPQVQLESLIRRFDDETGMLLGTNIKVDAHGIDQPVVEGAWDEQSTSTYVYTDNFWGRHGQLAFQEKSRIGGNTEQEAEFRTGESFQYDLEKPWRLKSTHAQGTEEHPLPIEERWSEHYFYDDEDQVGFQRFADTENERRILRGHIVQIEKQNGYQVGHPEYQKRVSIVGYDAEGFMPVCKAKLLDDDRLHVTTMRNHRVIGQTQSIRDPNGMTDHSWHDPFGRVRLVSSHQGEAVSFNYEPGELGGYKVRKSYLSGGQEQLSYDLQHKLLEKRDSYVSDVGENVRFKVFKYRYGYGHFDQGVDIDSPFDSVEMIGPFDAEDGIVQGQTPIVLTKKDRIGRVLEQTDSSGAVTRFRYVYDEPLTQNVVVKTDALGFEWTQRYDALGRLVQLVEPSVKDYREGGEGPLRHCEISYSYNAFRQITSMNVCGQVTQIGFDQRGRQAWIENPDISGRSTFEYNAFSELVSTTRPDGVTSRFQYDTIGRINEQTLFAADGQVHEKKITVYDQGPFAAGYPVLV